MHSHNATGDAKSSSKPAPEAEPLRPRQPDATVSLIVHLPAKHSCKHVASKAGSELLLPASCGVSETVFHEALRTQGSRSLW